VAVSAATSGERTPLACWFESLAIALRPLQRRPAETNIQVGSRNTRAKLWLFFNSLESASDVVDGHACGKVWG
jgi:hypothetical protein